MNAPTTLDALRQPGGDVAKAGGVKAQFDAFMAKLQPQLARALPAHMKADRMARLALTAFSANKDMQECSFQSIASSLMTAGALGLEPGVNGAGYLIPYKGVCTFVPGWKGLVDLVSRSGRATAWTGAVFAGDFFEFELGDRPFVRHRPGDETDPAALTHVYAVGRVNGSEWPVIEVWTIGKVLKHRDKYNKQGGRHYSFREPEMYARKVPLLQVLKYLPSSVEISNAIAASDAAESGRNVVIDGDFVTIADPAPDDNAAGAGSSDRRDDPPPALRDDPSPTISGEAFATRERATIRREPAGAQDAGEARVPAPAAFDADAFRVRLTACKDVDTLDVMVDELRTLAPAVAEPLQAEYRRARAALENSARPAGNVGRRTSNLASKAID